MFIFFFFFFFFSFFLNFHVVLCLFQKCLWRLVVMFLSFTFERWNIMKLWFYIVQIRFKKGDKCAVLAAQTCVHRRKQNKFVMLFSLCFFLFLFFLNLWAVDCQETLVLHCLDYVQKGGQVCCPGSTKLCSQTKTKTSNKEGASFQSGHHAFLAYFCPSKNVVDSTRMKGTSTKKKMSRNQIRKEWEFGAGRASFCSCVALSFQQKMFSRLPSGTYFDIFSKCHSMDIKKNVNWTFLKVFFWVPCKTGTTERRGEEKRKENHKEENHFFAEFQLWNWFIFQYFFFDVLFLMFIYIIIFFFLLLHEDGDWKFCVCSKNVCKDWLWYSYPLLFRGWIS